MVSLVNLATEAPGPSLASFLGLCCILLVGYAASIAIYNVFFHPLRQFPGPKLWAISALPTALNIARGRPHKKILELHKKYGDVVRVGPNELAFAHDDAWKEICGHLKHGQPENGKDPKWTNEDVDQSLISARRERHGPLRRILAHAFSARAMVEQQPFINEYIDLFLQRLRENGDNGTKPLNLTKWFEWATFDIIGDLAFGESFGCLRDSKSHPWVNILFSSMKSIPLMQVMRNRQTSIDFSRETLKKRIGLGMIRPDFVHAMLNNGQMSEREMIDTSVLLTTAGSETTATTLVATTYFLCSHPDVLAKLNAEVRSTFKSEAEIDIHSVQNLTYMLAVLKESMRVYPPVAIAMTRQTPACGAEINGRYVAGGASVGIWQYSVYHNPAKFLYPDSFIPDRWLGDKQFANDHRDLHQPFSYGPRNCIGMNLAYTEMRLILARIIWNFDLKMAPESEGWIDDQKVLFFWDKPALNVHLIPRIQIDAQ